MKRRDVYQAILASSITAAVLPRDAQAQTCTAPCYPATSAEIAAAAALGISVSALIIDSSFEEGHVDRYGTNANPGTTIMDTAVQRAVEVCKAGRIPVVFQARHYRITNTILLYSGSNLRGQSSTQYPDGYGSDPGGTTLIFEPTTLADCFQFQNNGAEFLYHVSISGMFIKGNGSSYSQYGINANGIIYGNFFDLSIVGFRAAIRLYRTINNRFTNVYASGSTSAIRYSGGSSTTDVWQQCTIWGSPIGIVTVGVCIGIRFVSCIFEQLDNYGADIIKDCQSFTFTDCYSEDVPYADNPDGAMFRVGHDGTNLIVENHLIIDGGVYQGRSAGTVGAFLSTDYCNGVIAGGFNVSRFTTVIKTTSHTRDHSIVVGGFAGISYASVTNDTSKLAGYYPTGVINTGSNHQNLSINSIVAAGSISAAGLVLTAASSASGAGFRIPHGAAPTSPVNGDIWSTPSGLFVRINGVTKTVTLT